MLRNHYKQIALSLLLATSLAACDKPGPAESAGKAIDQTASDTGKKISETTDKLEKKMDETASKTGVVIGDTEITTRVKAAIFAEPGLDSLKITVDTIAGVVTLSGSVDTPAHADKAKALTAAVGGVKDVVNHLTVVANK
ncbi:MAG: BON domain-containing protein [Azonexus sp.]